MPDDKELKQELQREQEAEGHEISGGLHDQNHFSDPADDYAKAAKDWKKIAKDYEEKAEKSGFDEETEYICRAAAAWFRAATNYRKVSERRTDKVDKKEAHEDADRAYRKAAELYEKCADRRIENGDLEPAQTTIERLISCYVYLGDEAKAERMHRTARKLRRWIEQMLKGLPLTEGD